MTQTERQAKNRVDAAIDSLGKVAGESIPKAPSVSIYDSDAAEVAERAIMRRFRTFATQHLDSSTDLDAYFHPINRSNWQRDFANWLIEQNQNASND